MASRPPANSRMSQLPTTRGHSRPGGLPAPSTTRSASASAAHPRPTSRSHAQDAPLASHLARRPPTSFTDSSLRRPRTAAPVTSSVASTERLRQDRSDTTEHMELEEEFEDIEEEHDDSNSDDEIIIRGSEPFNPESFGIHIGGYEAEMDEDDEQGEGDVAARRHANNQLIEMYRNHRAQHIDAQDLLAAVRVSLQQMADSLDDDNWIYEPENDVQAR